MSKQTAVEWLEAKVDGMIENGGDADLLAVIEHIQQAKAMEKEQLLDMGNQFAIIGEDSPEQYFDKTYK